MVTANAQRTETPMASTAQQKARKVRPRTASTRAAIVWTAAGGAASADCRSAIKPAQPMLRDLRILHWPRHSTRPQRKYTKEQVEALAPVPGACRALRGPDGC